MLATDKTSVFELEKHFQYLRQFLSMSQSSRLKLDYLHQFLCILNTKKNRLLFQSYYQELLPYFLEYILPETLIYRSIDFLEDLRISSSTIKEVCPKEGNSSEFSTVVENLNRFLAKTNFYLGQWRKGLAALMPGFHPDEQVGIFADLDVEVDASPLEQLEGFISALGVEGGRASKIGVILQEIAEEWREMVEYPRSDCVWILLIEKDTMMSDSTNRHSVGTIQPLALKASIRPLDADEDLLLFNNRTMFFDDLMNQQAQDAVQCARDVLMHSHFMRDRYGLRTKMYCKMIYSFPDKTAFYTGDSMGLAMGLLNSATMSDMCGGTFHYLLRQNMAVTGSLDILGNVRPISEQSLNVKLETLFYSPFSNVLVPAKNKDQADKILSPLYDRYPERRLEVHESGTLKDCLSNSSVVVREKVPLSQRVISRRRRKYIALSMGLFLIATLAAGGYLLTRDTNPARFEIDGKYMRVKNVGGRELWRYNFGYELSAANYTRGAKNPRYLVEDLDGDSKNEVVIGTSEPEYNEFSGTLFFFESDGTLVWRFQDHPTLTFGEEVMDNLYTVSFVYAHDFDHDGQSELVAGFSHHLWYPQRILLMDLNGKALGDYWNSGAIRGIEFLDIDQDGIKEILFYGTNNDYNQAILGVIEHDHVGGHSPQDQPAYTPVGISAGTERYYIRFPSARHIVSYGKGNRGIVRKVVDLGNNELRIFLAISGRSSGLLYKIDYQFNVLQFDFSDDFYLNYKRQYGRDLYEDFTHEEIQRHFRTLEFWDGDRWVTEPTENKY